MKYAPTIASLLIMIGLATPYAVARQAGGDPKEAGAAPAAPADNAEAKMILEACGQAIKKARAITFNGTYHPVGGMLEGLLGTQRAQVKMLRAPAPDAAPSPDDAFVILMVGTDTDSKKKETQIEVSLQHSSIEWVDAAAHKVMERPQKDMEARNKITQASTFLRNEEFLKAQPLGDLHDAVASLDGTESLDGVTCDIVTLTRGKGKKERWSIATTDRLPRRIATIPAGNNGELVFELAGLTVDNSDTPTLTLDQMRVHIPEGFTEDRRLAPVPRPTPPAPPMVPSSGPEKGEETKSTPVAPAPPPEPPKPVDAPEFNLTVGRGANGAPASGSVKLSELHDSVVVLDFFGTWTIAAPEWHAELDSLAKDTAFQSVKFFALDVRKNPDAAIAYMNQEKRAPELLMNADRVAKAYGVRVYPATVVVGTDGKVVELVQGSRAGGESKRLVKEAIEKALGHAPAPSASGDSPVAPDAPAKAPATDSK